MKRMYVVLIVMFLLILGALSTCLAQFSTPPNEPQKFDRQKRRAELREEMHRRMRDKLLRGIGPDQDLFKDMEQMFEDSMNDSFSSFDSIAGSSSSAFSTEWLETGAGKTLVITPKDPHQQLDIDVKNGMVTIKGKAESKENNSSFVSSFSNSFSIPGDCDPDKVKTLQKDGKIMLEFPYREMKKVTTPKKEERKPLPPAEGAVEI